MSDDPKEAERRQRHEERRQRHDLGSLGDLAGEEFTEEVEGVFSVDGPPKLLTRNRGELDVDAAAAALDAARGR